MNAPFPLNPQLAHAIAAVIDAGCRASDRGWAPANAGLFSARVDANHIALTRNGVDKCALQTQDIVVQPLDAPLRPGAAAAAALHLRRYRDDPRIGALFDAHSPAAAAIGRAHAETGAVTLEGWDLQKALSGVRNHAAQIEIPVFANDHDAGALAGRIAERLAAPAPAPWLRAPGYLIAGRGLTAWGADGAEAWRHLEALETLSQQMLSYRSYRP